MTFNGIELLSQGETIMKRLIDAVAQRKIKLRIVNDGKAMKSEDIEELQNAGMYWRLLILDVQQILTAWILYRLLPSKELLNRRSIAITYIGPYNTNVQNGDCTFETKTT